MAQTNYSKTMCGPKSRSAMTWTEYQSRRTEFAPRGQDLPQAKLLDIDVIDIRSAKRQRDNMLKYIKENLSNEALCTKHGIHARTLEKVLSRETWCHLP